MLSKYRENITIFAVFDLFPYFIWVLTIGNTILTRTCWCCGYKLSKITIMYKSIKFVSYHILHYFFFFFFFFWVNMILIKMTSRVYILIANKVYIMIFTSKRLISLAFLKNLSSHRTTLKLQSGGPFISWIKLMK